MSGTNARTLNVDDDEGGRDAISRLLRAAGELAPRSEAALGRAATGVVCTEMPRVLIVEDELILSLTLRRQLEQAGVEVVGVACDGQSAVQLCQQARPDVVLMDIRIPDMDGIEATRRIMAHCPTRVVMLTAMDAPGEAATAAAEAGAAAWLPKPVDIAMVLAARNGSSAGLPA